MAINLRKGGSIDLKKKDGGALNNVLVGLGWSAGSMDLDASVYMMTTRGEVVASTPVEAPKKRSLMGKLFGAKDTAPTTPATNNGGAGILDTVSYRHLTSNDRSIRHQGDNLVGGSGCTDDEQIKIDLSSVSASVERLVVGVNIYSAGARHFGQVKKAYARIVDQSTGEEMARFNLADEYSGNKAIIVGSLNRTLTGWKFVAIGKGSNARNIDSLGREA